MVRRRTSPPLDLRTHTRPYVSVRALAEYLELDERTVRRMIDMKTIAAVRAGRQWRIPTDEARRVFHVEQQ